MASPTAKNRVEESAEEGLSSSLHVKRQYEVKENVDELMLAFVRALHENNESSKANLSRVVASYTSKEEGLQLKRTESMIKHYLRRLINHFKSNVQSSDPAELLSLISKAFPELSQEAIQKVLEVDYQSTSAEGTKSKSSGGTAKNHTKDIFKFDDSCIPKTFQGEVVRGDHLIAASFNTEQDLRNFEKVFKKDSHNSKEIVLATLSPDEEVTNTLLSPIYPSSANLTAQVDRSDMKCLMGHTDMLRNAFDVISAFSTGSLDGKVNFVYLNYKMHPGSPGFDPYALDVVSRASINPEHYVFSRFGVMHVHRDGTTDNFSFAEWCTHAFIYCILKQIPVFKRYFMQKMLRKWKSNVISIIFRRRCKALSKLTVHFFPDFDISSVKIQHLINQATTLTLFRPRPEVNFSLPEFQDALSKSLAFSQKPLARLFKLCQQTVKELEEGKIADLRDIQLEIANQPFVSALPISKQKEQASYLSSRLATLQHHVQQLDNLTRLFDRMVSSNLISMAEENATLYINSLLPASRAMQPGDEENPVAIIQAKYYIDPTKGLAMKPSWSDVKTALLEGFVRIGSLLVDTVQPTRKKHISSVEKPSDKLPTVSLSPFTAKFKEGMSSLQHTKTVTSQKLAAAQQLVNTSALQVDEAQRYSPLDKYNFRILLMQSECISAASNKLEIALQEAELELETFSVKQAWILDAFKFVTTHQSLQIVLDLSDSLSITLCDLEGWMSAAENLPTHFTSKNGLICVSISAVKSLILSSLQEAYTSLIKQIETSLQSKCQQLDTLLNGYIKALQIRRFDVNGVATYTQLLRECERESIKAKPIVESIKLVFETLVHHNVQVGSLCDTLKQTLEVWSDFQEHYESGTTFVKTKIPVSIKALERSLEDFDQKVQGFITYLNSGELVDPFSDSSTVLQHLKAEEDNIFEVKSLLTEYSHYKEIIMGENHDLTLVSEMMNLLDARHELWKQMEVGGSQIREWQKVEFKKFDFLTCLSTLQNWLRSTDSVTKQLPKNDLVLAEWINRIKKFHEIIRLVERLTSPAIKISHWHSIFTAMGFLFDRTFKFTIGDLIEHDISQYADNIIETCHKAEAEFHIEKTLSEMQARWERTTLKVDLLPAGQYSSLLQKRKQSTVKRAKARVTFDLGSHSALPRGKSEYEDLCILTDTEELFVFLQDDIMHLQVLLQSPQLSKVKGQMSHQLDLLQQLQDLLLQLVDCQNEWKHLLDLFQDFESSALDSFSLSSLKEATTDIQNILRDIYVDGRALLLVQKMQGAKGGREMQGSMLKGALKIISLTLEKQKQQVMANCQNVRLSFPRLFFSDAKDALMCDVPSLNPLELLPLIKRCFPDISNFRLGEKYSHDKPSKEDGHYIHTILGPLGEELHLLSLIPLGRYKPKEWLPTLDRAIRTSLACLLTICSESFPAELDSYSPLENKDTAIDMTGEVLQWLMKYPHQCVILSLECFWSTAIQSCLEPLVNCKKLEELSIGMNNHLKLFSSLMYQLPNKVENTSQRRKIFLLLGSLVLLLQNKIDWLSHVISIQHVTADSFDVSSGVMLYVVDTSVPVTSSSTRTLSGHELGSGYSQSLLQHKVSECSVEYMNNRLTYGYEMQRLGSKVAILPQSERYLLQMIQSMQQQRACALYCHQRDLAESLLTKPSTDHDLAQVLGRPYYSFCLPLDPGRSRLCNLLLGTLATGAVTSLHTSERSMSSKFWVVLANLMSEIQHAMAQCVEQAHDDLSQLLSRTVPSSASARSALSTHSSSSTYQKVNWYKCSLQDPFFQGSSAVSLFGNSVLISPTSLLCLKFSTEHAKTEAQLPQEIKNATRTVCWMCPDAISFSKCLLLASGFQYADEWSSLMAKLWRELPLMVPMDVTCLVYDVVREVVSEAESYLCVLASAATEQYYLHSKAKEKEALVTALSVVLKRRLQDEELHKAVVTPLIEKYFKEVAAEEIEEDFVSSAELFELRELRSALETEMSERHLQESQELVNKCLEIHSVLKCSPGVVLSGGPCFGKTTALTLLTAAYQNLQRAGMGDNYLGVKTITIHPAAYTLRELLGSDECEGLLCKLFHHATTMEDIIQRVTHNDTSVYFQNKFERLAKYLINFSHWIIFQGPLSPDLAERLTVFLRKGQKLMEMTQNLTLPKSVRIIIETNDIDGLTPDLISTVQLVRFSPSVVRWEMLVNTWLEEAKTKHSFNNNCRSVLRVYLNRVIPIICEEVKHSKLLVALQQNQIITLLLKVFSAVFVRILPKRAFEGSDRTSCISSRPPSQISLTSTASSRVPSSRVPSQASSRVCSAVSGEDPYFFMQTYPPSDRSVGIYTTSTRSGYAGSIQILRYLPPAFVYTIIWALYPLLGVCNAKTSAEFDQFVRDLLDKLDLFNELPDEGLVTDYFYDVKTSSFQTWSQKCDELKGDSKEEFVPTTELVMACHVTELMVSSGNNVLLLGEQNVGLSAAVKNLLSSKFPLTRIPIYPERNPDMLRDFIMQIYHKGFKSFDSRKGGFNRSQKMAYFIDNICLSTKWSFDSGSLIEAIQEAAVENTVTDPNCLFQPGIHGARFIMSVPPSEVKHLGERVFTHFVPVSLLAPSSESLTKIMKTNLASWASNHLNFKLDEETIQHLVEAVSLASVTVHLNIKQKLTASPSYPCYNYSIKELTELYRGLKAFPEAGKESAGTNIASKIHKGKRGNPTRPLPKVSRMKEDLMRQATRGRRKLRAALDADEEAAHITLIRNFLRLWCNEVARVYGDRIHMPTEVSWFNNLLTCVAKVSFCGPLSWLQGEMGQQKTGKSARTARGKHPRRGSISQPVAPDSQEYLPHILERASKLGIDISLLASACNLEKLVELIPSDQIFQRGEDLTKLNFVPMVHRAPSQNPSVTDIEGTATSLGNLPAITSTFSVESVVDLPATFKEWSDRDLITSVNDHVSFYNKTHGMNIVPYRVFTDHMLKICRLLTHSKSHGLVVGPSGCGKKSICKIAASITGTEVIELCCEDAMETTDFTYTIRDACTSAIVDCRDTVLLVSGQFTKSQWNTIYLLMKEFDINGIFSSGDIVEVAARIRQSSLKFPQHMRYTDSLKTLQEGLERNFHIIILWSLPQGLTVPCVPDAHILQLLASSTSNIINLGSLDLESCSDIAIKWLEEHTSTSWQNEIAFPGGLMSLAELAANIHITASTFTSDVPGKLTSTASTFIALLKVGHQLCLAIQQREKNVLSQVKEIQCVIAQTEVEISDLECHLDAARLCVRNTQEEVDSLMNEITSFKEAYIEANKRCKEAENVIDREMSNVEELSIIVQQVMDKVSSKYTAALNGLSSVQKNDILELMSYKCPPESLQPVLYTLCIVFDRAETWEDCKQLLLTKNFFEHMKYFDRDSIPKSTLKCIRNAMMNKRLDSAFVGRGSTAALSISTWLKALVAYHDAKNYIRPHEVKLKNARGCLSEAKQVYSNMKLEMDNTKLALEKKILGHKQSLQKLRCLEKHTDHLQSEHKDAKALMAAVSSFSDSVNKKGMASLNCFQSAPIESLLVSGSAVYLTTLSPDTQAKLFSSWLDYCKGKLNPGEVLKSGRMPDQGGGERVPLRDDFAISEIFTKDYLRRSRWHLGPIPMSAIGERLLLAKVLATSRLVIPVVFDPDRYIQMLTELSVQDDDDGESDTAQNISLEGGNEPATRDRLTLIENCHQLMHIPGDFNEKLTYPRVVHANGMTMDSVSTVLSDADSPICFCFTSMHFATDEIIETILHDVHHCDGKVKVAIVIYQSLESCLTHTNTVTLLQHRLLLQSSRTSHHTPVFAPVSLEMSEGDLNDYFCQRVLKRLSPTNPIRYHTILSDISTHESSIVNSEVQLTNSIIKVSSLLENRKSMLELASAHNETTKLAHQRLVDSQTQLANHLKNIAIFSKLSAHCSFLYSTVRRLQRDFPYLSLSLPQFEDVFDEVFVTSKVWLPSETSSLLSVATCAMEQVNQVLFPLLASRLLPSHYMQLLLLCCITIWKKKGIIQENEVGLLTDLSLKDCLLFANVQHIVNVLLEDTHMSMQELLKLNVLEQFFSVLGMTESSQPNMEIWEEHFQHSANCLNTFVPCTVNTWQRLLLWQVVKPQKFPKMLLAAAKHEISPQTGPWLSPQSINGVNQSCTTLVIPHSSEKELTSKLRSVLGTSFDLWSTADEIVIKRLSDVTGMQQFKSKSKRRENEQTPVFCHVENHPPSEQLGLLDAIWQFASHRQSGAYVLASKGFITQPSIQSWLFTHSVPVVIAMDHSQYFDLVSTSPVNLPGRLKPNSKDLLEKGRNNLQELLDLLQNLISEFKDTTVFHKFLTFSLDQCSQIIQVLKRQLIHLELLSNGSVQLSEAVVLKLVSGNMLMGPPDKPVHSNFKHLNEAAGYVRAFQMLAKIQARGFNNLFPVQLINYRLFKQSCLTLLGSEEQDNLKLTVQLLNEITEMDKGIYLAGQFWESCKDISHVKGSKFLWISTSTEGPSSTSTFVVKLIHEPYFVTISL